MHGKLLNYLWSQLDKLQRQTAVKHHHCLCGAMPLCEMLLQQLTRWLGYEEPNHDQRKSMRSALGFVLSHREPAPSFHMSKVARGETWASHVAGQLRAHGRLSHEIEVQDSAIQSVKDIAQKWKPLWGTFQSLFTATGETKQIKLRKSSVVASFAVIYWNLTRNGADFESIALSIVARS